MVDFREHKLVGGSRLLVNPGWSSWNSVCAIREVSVLTSVKLKLGLVDSKLGCFANVCGLDCQLTSAVVDTQGRI